MVTGLTRPDAGSIHIFGIDALADPLAAKAVTAWLPDEPMLYDKLTPSEYLGFVAGLWRIAPDEAAPEAERLLKWLELWDSRDTRCETFSRGMKQKVALAGALIHRPRLLILDEPLTGLDANAALVVKELIRSLAAQGRTIFFCSHVLEVVERVCSRIIIIDNGRAITDGTPAQIASQAGARSLEEAFVALTGTRDAVEVTNELLQALEG
jgi:ABC-2 type transport system ATP-binding protein